MASPRRQDLVPLDGPLQSLHLRWEASWAFVLGTCVTCCSSLGSLMQAFCSRSRPSCPGFWAAPTPGQSSGRVLLVAPLTKPASARCPDACLHGTHVHRLCACSPASSQPSAQVLAQASLSGVRASIQRGRMEETRWVRPGGRKLGPLQHCRLCSLPEGLWVTLLPCLHFTLCLRPFSACTCGLELAWALGRCSELSCSSLEGLGHMV